MKQTQHKTNSLSELQNLRNELLPIFQKYGATNVRVFGSFARKEIQEDSDIDFLVNLDDNRSAFDLVHLIDELENLLKRKIDIGDEEAIHPYIKQQVLEEAVLL